MIEWNDCIVFILAKSHQKIQREFKKLLAPFELTPIQFLAMALITTEQGISGAEICERLLIDKSTLSGVLERIEAKGLVVRQTDVSDRRITAIRLSETGLKMAEQLTHIPEAINEIAMKSMSLEERLLLKRLLRDICA